VFDGAEEVQEDGVFEESCRHLELLSSADQKVIDMARNLRGRRRHFAFWALLISSLAIEVRKALGVQAHRQSLTTLQINFELRVDARSVDTKNKLRIFVVGNRVLSTIRSFRGPEVCHLHTSRNFLFKVQSNRCNPLKIALFANISPAWDSSIGRLDLSPGQSPPENDRFNKQNPDTTSENKIIACRRV
jgi:hypothetical protein